MVASQTKTADPDTLLHTSSLTAPQMEAFRGGAALFNRGEYFEAHEFWEKDWRKLPLPHRSQVQAAILTCGFFVLIGKGRLDPAVRLAKLAIERFAEAAAQTELFGKAPVLDLPNVEEHLMRMLAQIQLGETDAGPLLSGVKSLRVNVKDGV